MRLRGAGVRGTGGVKPAQGADGARPAAYSKDDMASDDQPANVAPPPGAGAPGTGAPVASHCHRCGTLVPGGARYCAHCGSQLSSPGLAPPGADGAAAAAAARLLQALRHDLAGQYDVESEVGRGGMAVVFRATELELGRVVALKVLPPELALNPSIAERFKREARMTAALDHPNIMPVYRVGQAAGVPFMAMRFVEGRSLDAIIEAQGALPLPVMLLILRAAT